MTTNAKEKEEAEHKVKNQLFKMSLQVFRARTVEIFAGARSRTVEVLGPHVRALGDRVRSIPIRPALQVSTIVLGIISSVLTAMSYWADRDKEIFFLVILLMVLISSVAVALYPPISASISVVWILSDSEKQLIFFFYVTATTVLSIATILMIYSCIVEHHYWYGPSREAWITRRFFATFFSVVNCFLYGWLSVDYSKELPVISGFVEEQRERASKIVSSIHAVHT